MNANETLAESFETFVRTNIDNGRVMGYVIGLREVIETNECYAWVQRSVETKDGWKDYGVVQRSRKFPTTAAARAWAYSTAKERASRI